MQVLPDFWHLTHGLPGFGWSHLTFEARQDWHARGTLLSGWEEVGK
jgi:hypothetical protein